MGRIMLLVLGACVVLSVALVLAQDKPEEKPAEDKPSYLGMAGWKSCQKNKKRTLKLWQIGSLS